MHMAAPTLEGLVNPDMLVWARQATQMEAATAAKRLQTSESRLLEWERGTRVPTLNQLRKLAHIYKRSVGIFFLRSIPQARPQPIDYRRLELSAEQRVGTELAVGIRDAEAKREAALDIFIQLEDQPPEFSLFVDRNLDAEGAARDLSKRLGMTLDVRARWTNEYEALSAWKSAIESLGVLVLQLPGVSIEQMRGCSIALYPLPVIILNSSDSPLGRIFTLIHELAHLSRIEGGLCDMVEDAPRKNADQALEVYCNRVAGAVMVPEQDLMRIPEVQRATENTRWGIDELGFMRRVFWASREVILRRLLILHRTSQAHYQQMRDRFAKEYAAMREREKGFVPFPRRVVLNNGRYLTRLVLDAYRSSVITGTELSRILGTKLDHLPKIADVLGGREAA